MSKPSSSEQKNYEEKMVQNIAQHIPVSYLPESIQKQYLPYNPFDKERLTREYLDSKVIPILKEYLCIDLRLIFQRLENCWTLTRYKHELMLTQSMYEEIDQYLCSAGYTKTIIENDRVGVLYEILYQFTS